MTSSVPSLSNLKSGFFVSLIALPLCLGIAIASGFPPIAGIYTAIIGGIVCSFLGSSRLTIKGPAAGLIVIALGAVQELGQGDMILGYHRALAVGAMAAVLQIVFSKVKAGRLGVLIPPSVVHGMLAAIGVIILAKQIHVMLGVAPYAQTPLQLIGEIPDSLIHEDPFISILGLITIVGLFLFPRVPLLKKLPAALLDLLIVIPLGLYWKIGQTHMANFMGKDYELGPKFLVHIPTPAFSSITFPDWTALTTGTGWKFVIMFALVGSVESLLTVSAVDGLDPERRPSNLDKDLFSVGVGNLLSSLVGGLPMISEIVRSRANIDNGATGVASNFIHGFLLLLAVAFIPTLINDIPLSSLAAMLVVTGYRLASPREFIKTHQIGWDQLLLFVTTLVVTIGTNLLAGVAVGILLKISLHVVRGVSPKHLFKLELTQTQADSQVTLQPLGPCVFTNLIKLEDAIQNALSAGKNVTVDFSSAEFVDHSTLERLDMVSHTLKSQKLIVTGLDQLKGVSAHELATRQLV